MPFRAPRSVVLGRLLPGQLPGDPTHGSLLLGKPGEDLHDPGSGLGVDDVAHPRLRVATTAADLAALDRLGAVAERPVAHGITRQHDPFLTTEDVVPQVLDVAF